MKCPKCGYKIECHATIKNEKIKPKNGDISICLKCGAVHQFMDDNLVDVTYNSLPFNIKKQIIMINQARFKVMNR